MRTLPLATASRMGLQIALVLALACAEDPVETPNAGLLTDYATGVDASFGVQAFALGPTLAITSPSDFQVFKIVANGQTDISVQFTVKDFTLGKVNCYLDGSLNGAATKTPYTFKNVKKGLHTLGCLLATDNGQEQANAEARAVVRVKVVPTCLFPNECDDGLACTQNDCVNGKCKFEAVPNCCGSPFDCSAGDTCLNANSEKSQCTSCQKDVDCDDSEICTKDVCDLSGPKGVCKHNKTDPQCCSKKGVGQCDDGKSCTVDACDLATGKCTHVKPDGVCCGSAECSSDDTCKVGACVDNECRFGPDKFKPGCCHDDAGCDDKYYCNTDKCDKVMPGNWKQCTHVPDPTKNGPKGEPCCDPLNQTDECDDGNTCTWDICTNYQCENKVLAECCKPATEAKEKKCDDLNACTLDLCEVKNEGDDTGTCKHKKIANCCNQFSDCNDGLFCTKDTCNMATKSCVYKKDNNACCDQNKECDDGKTCTTGYCVNHGCYFGKDPDKPSSCCDENGDCNDNNACTVDSCNQAVNTCVFTSNGEPNCCNSPADCDDNDCTTTDFCDAANLCAHKSAPYACKQNIDCDDGKPCTKDICDASGGCGVCKNEPEAACCELDGQCSDGKACTVDKCVGNKCDNSGVIKNCCTNNLDAPKACDDNNKCTIEYCLNNQCRHTVPKQGCCVGDSDCDDGDSCTVDKCALNGGSDGVCSFTKKADCKSCTPQNAAVNCNDNNPCTVESCTVDQYCSHTAKKDCCLDVFDCDDNNPCTYDGCVFNQCWHSENAGSEKLCCKPETEAVDCADKNSQCGIGKCRQQPDSKWLCVAEAKKVCTFNVGYCQAFENGGSLPLMGWNPANIKGTAGTNWGIDVDAGLGPDQHPRLTWTPIKVNYDTCLTSPVFQAAGANTITLQFDREFIKNVGTTNVRVLGSLDGENADWTKGVVIDTWNTGKSIGAETVDVKLPPILSGSNGLRLAFCVSGASTFDLTKVGVDNFCIAKGSAPNFTACPPNHAAEMGYKKKIPIKAKDADLNDVISFSLVKAPSFVTLSTALFYWLDSSWNATLSVFATSKDDIGEHEVTIKVSDGKLYKLCTFRLTILYKGGVLIWRPTKVPKAHAKPVVSAIKGATGKILQVIDDISLYPDLKPFDAVFVLLGVYPDNHVLTNSEIKGLKLYLSGSGKGRLYMEGGDTWAFDKATDLHPFFKVTGVLDSAPNGVTGPLTGNSVYNDANNPTKVFNWGYSQSFAFNNLNDQIAGQTSVKRTGNLLRNSGVEKFWAHVGHDDKSAAYRTIGSSVLFSGVTNGDDTPLTLMKRIFNFFDNGFPDCKDDKGCNDGNACTIDKCNAGGDCSHTNNCLCSSETQLKCDAAPKKLVTNSGAATQTIEKYPCDLSGTKYDGKEISYGFVSADSRPVQVKYTNVNNSNARVFVLKATAKGCDPTGCIGTAAIVNGSATLNFAAAAGVQYHLVMDVPGALNSAQFDMQISCSEGEICDDGKDNNLNGLTDCYDLKSCCGDKNCPEVCDGLDNDCNSKVDEGCDDDGDLYCDVGMKVMKGAKCTKSSVPTEAFKQVQGDDCTDDDGTVNPGASEICKNGKDDNCNGKEDEIDAIGCVKYFTDLDFDDYGTGDPKCLCAPSGAYKAKVGGDCFDNSKDINPGVPEKCATENIDDNCNGSKNDVNAVGCKNFYTDLDSDAWGTTPFKCMCIAEGVFKAPKPGDCDDAVAKINPASPEVCNNIDDNCDGAVDEGCDDDGDDYCDADFKYDPTKEPIKVCPKGAGDSDDEDPAINPEGKEICDDKDNDSDGKTDEDCNKDGDTYCDAKIVTVGNPKVCVSGGGDCKDDNTKVHPSMKETCDTSYDDNCNDTANDINADNCTPYFYDGDSDKWGTSSHQCLCLPKDSFTAVNPGDCKDANPAINPGVVEVCDDIDNDCDGVVDNGCDEDKDGYCNSLKTLIGSPKVCPSGPGDCDDTDGNVNPAKAEVCGNGKDDNCNGSQNDLGAVGCNNFWPDGDDDNFGDDSVSAQCLCEAKGGIKATNNSDCNDKSAAINPVAAEKCDNLDNDCDGKTDEGCDDDKDGYCDGFMVTMGSPTVCPKGSGDCNDEDPNIFKGKSSEVCDGKDDDCNGVVDNGCDKDQDGFCDGAMIVAAPPPPVCLKGGGDCDDLNYDANPAATEVCNNNIDDNCNGSTNDEKAVGCTDFYFDGDGDKFGLNLSKCLCTGAGAYTAVKGGDCADDNNKIHPNATEVCDNVDNNCNGAADEAGAQGCKDAYFDNDGDGYGLPLKQCLCGGGVKPYTAVKTGDCNDENAKVNPGVTEICDDADNNCDAQVDEKCNQDGDKFCSSKMTVIGSPSACVLGGGDCDDTDGDVHPAGNEICNDKDDNCDGKIDQGCDDDGDGYCDANMGLSGSSDKQHLTSDFEAGVPGSWTASSAKTSSCGSYGTILGGAGIYGAGAWAQVKLTNLGVHKSLKVEFDWIKIDSWDGESGQMLVDSKQAWSKSYIYSSGKQECGGGGGWNELSERITAIVVHTGDSATIRFTSTLNQLANDESWGIDNVVVTTLGSLPKGCAKGGGDCNDNNKAINPGALELCGNSVDENCSGDANDDGAQGCSTFYKDLDADNYGADGNDTRCLCKADGLYVGTKAGDCDDGNNLVNAGATEVCDGVDNNCDKKIDEGCDNDNDGYCDANLTTIGKPAVCPSGGGDCNDDNDAKGEINPGATEVCGNNIDENCDGSLNSNAAGNCTEYFYDGDGDGFGVNVKQCLCTPENGFTASKAGDCDDTDKVINPDAIEVCGNGKDDNCNGTSNEKDAKGCVNFYKDGDADGYGAGTAQCQCSAEGAFITKIAGDCDDADKNTHPGAAEICDGKDNSCKGAKDKGCDDDLDGYCDINMTVIKGALCLKSVPVCEGVIYNSKCYQAYPIAKTPDSARTACKNIGGSLITIENQDENEIAEQARKKGCGSAAALIGLSDVAVEGKWVWDDKSSFNYSNWNAGEPNNSGEEDAVHIVQGGKWNDVSVTSAGCYICELGKVTIGGGDDCNDTDKTVNPGVVETCDDKDNNCDGKADEQCDDDKDGYCNKDRLVVGTPKTCANGGGDCDDGNNLIYPGKTELCDDHDNNCDGKKDEGCDDDGDGYCDLKMSTLGKPEVCNGGGGDCDDTKKGVNPGAVEVCDGVDNNCASGIDEVCNDEDGDGYCKGNVPVDAGCPKGGNDCDDGDKSVNPGAKENCKTDTDDNCNKKINEIDALNCKNFYNDNDGDNYGADSKCDGTTIDGMCVKAYGESAKAFKQSKTWFEAKEACELWGGDLVSVGSAAENAEFVTLAKNTCGASNAWIGLHDKPPGLDKPVTFTNCGKTGRDGPSQSNCNSSYNGSPLAGKVTLSGGVQKWTVPTDGTYIIEAFGARGYNGGYGARMKGSFQFKGGQVLELVVGQMGSSGGGNGGGGGGTFVYTGATLYIAAGGGGGQSPGKHGTTSNNGTSGNNGSGGTNGKAGTGTYMDGSGPGAGWNGYDTLNDSSNAIGAKSRPTWTGGRAIRHGYTSHGGFGGGGFSIHPAGGGGGYSGGGAGGGGGGSYNVGGSQSNSSGANSTHGKIIITSPKSNSNASQEWLNKSTLLYTNWAAGQPGSEISSKAGFELQVSDGKWKEVAANEKRGCYICRKSKTWAESQAACASWGGNLASIMSSAENDSYLSQAKSKCGTTSTWIGLHDKGSGLSEPVNFTNCKKTGRLGPTQSECNSVYAGTLLEGNVTVAGGVQSWKVPVDGDYVIEAFGARGYNGGNGARMKGTFTLKKGVVLQIVVGQMGTLGCCCNGGGGGGTFVYTGDTLHIAAGGGGGQSPGHPGTTSKNGTNGSNGSGGSNGGAGTGTHYDGSGPGAGWNGYDTLNDSSNAIGAKSRPTWLGGESIRHNYQAHGGFGGGGFSIHPAGGGGGYSGGGAGGGGGGSYNVGKNQSNSGGANNTHGKVTITSPKVNMNNEQEWLDQLPIGYVNWAAKQPDDKTAPNDTGDPAEVVEMLADGKWNDVGAGQKRSCFVCKKMPAFACLCYQQGTLTGLKGGDCDDTNPSINPLAIEICDNVDNDCLKGVDNGCDDDKDGFCAAGKLIGDPPAAETLVFTSTFESGAPNWTGTSTKTTSCGSYGNVLGGYNVYGQGASAVRSLTALGKHTQLRVIFHWLKVDSWDGEAGQLYLDGKLAWSQVYNNNKGAQTCGNGNPEQREKIELLLPHTQSVAKLEWKSTLNQGPTDESWAIDNVTVYTSDAKTLPKLVEAEVLNSNFENGSVGWEGSSKTVTTCGSFTKILGGYSVYGQGSNAVRNLKGLNKHNKLRVNFTWLKLDTWDGESGQLYIDGKLAWSKSYNYPDGKQVCGNGAPDLADPIELTVEHTANTAKLEWKSTLNQGPTDESWGIDNVTAHIALTGGAAACPKTGTVDTATCKAGKLNDVPPYIGKTLNFDTRSHGGGFHSAYNEWWYPQWSGTYVYRYNADTLQYLGNFNTGQNCMMQLWADTDGGSTDFYTSNWGYNTITKIKGKSSSRLWTRSIGSTAGGVATDSSYVYGMRHSGRTVYVLNKSNGSVVKTFDLNGGTVNNNHGGLTIVDGKFFYGNSDRKVERFSLPGGNYDNATFNTAPNIYNTAFNGKDYCVSANNSSVYCYTLVKAKSGCTTGDDCDDKDKDINPGNLEICDDKDNNCDLITDDNCDADQDGYCSPEAGLVFGNCCDGHGGKGCNVTAIKECVCKNLAHAECCTKAWDKTCATAAATLKCTTCQFPSACAKGGSDCDDKNSAINLEAAENCTTPADDNCDGIIDELNALGCVKFYYDSDGDGAGVPSYECRCAPNGKFKALESGDCDDDDPAITAGVTVKAMKSPKYIGKTINMNTRSHGGGYSPSHNEYWYPQWSGTTIYRYDKQYQYKGSFSSGQNCMMQLWGDTSEDTYYTANWGYNSCTKRKGMTNSQVWHYNVGSTSGGVATDDTYAYCMRHSGNNVYVLNKTTGGHVKNMGLSGGSVSYQYGGMAIAEGKLWYGNGNRNVYRYNLANGQYDGGSFTTSPNIYNMAFDGELYCVSSNNSSVYCYKMYEVTTLPELCDGKDNNCNITIDEGCDLDKDGYCGPTKVVVDNKACPKSPSGKAKCTPDSGSETPIFVGVRSINTRSHGGGFSPKYNEWWYPQWAGGTIYRYDGTSNGYKGAFNSGQGSMMQLWGESDGTYETANWGYNTISRKHAYSSSTIWNRNIGSTAGAVTSDDNYVYGMRYYDRTVYRLSKSNGQVQSTFSLSGGYVTTTYGGLAAVNGKLWRGNYNRQVDRFDITSGQYDGKTFHTAPYIYNMAYTGKDYCVSSNNSSVYCYRMFVKGDCVMGDDCDDYDKTVFPSKQEVTCDDKDNNCNGVIDDGCDADGDGYCGVKKTTFGAPKVCTKGGGDCDDAVKSVNPSAEEVCNNGKDDNCDGIQDEENSVGCKSWYYDGDQDGYGLDNNNRCLCKGDGLYSTQKVGDCDDKCSTCYPNAPEVCDGLNNKCGSTLLNSVSNTGTLFFNTRSHGGGFNPVYNEFWYPQWAGSTVYRYTNKKGNAGLGSFNSGQGSIMQLWAAADEGGDYYTANWGYNKINKWKSKSSTNVWSFNIGSTAGGVTSDDQFVYAMRNSGSTVWKLDRGTGKQISTFNLSGGSVSGIHGSLVANSGKLYRGNSNGTVYRYRLADGGYDGVNFKSSVNIYNTSFDNDSYCVSANASTVYCYRLTQPGSVIDKDCDKDGDGYCDKNMTTIGTPPACPKGGLDCNDGAKTIHPGAPEKCNKSDDNCNGVIDEGAADTCNKQVYQAQATCDSKKGQCVILKCSDSFFDANGLISDGCECSGSDAWEPNDSCSKSVEISKNVHDGGKGPPITLMGKVVDKTDSDWYKFYAVDHKDSGVGVCDRFNVRVRFLQNPGGLAFEVHRGACPNSKSAVCCGDTDFNWFTNFKGYNKHVYSSYHSEYGECPCNTEKASNNNWSTRLGYNQQKSQGGPYCSKWTNGVCIPRGYDITECKDDSSWFYVRVWKKSGGPSCTPYQLEITNGIYGAPGHKGKSGF